MKNRITLVLISFLFLSLIVYITRETPIINSFSGVVQKAFYYPRAFFYHAKIDIQNPFNFDRGNDLEKIKKENSRLLEKMADYERLKNDNKALRGQFETSDFKPQILLAANVIGFSGKPDFPDSLIIDKGEEDGVKEDAAIVSGKNLVGKVQKVSKYFSKIILPVNKNFSLVGKTSSTGALGVIKGEEDFMLFNNVLITENLSDSDIILTRGDVNDLGVGIPPDIIIGKISSIYKQENKPFQNAKINNLVDYSGLRIVFVLKTL